MRTLQVTTHPNSPEQTVQMPIKILHNAKASMSCQLKHPPWNLRVKVHYLISFKGCVLYGASSFTCNKGEVLQSENMWISAVSYTQKFDSPFHHSGPQSSPAIGVILTTAFVIWSRGKVPAWFRLHLLRLHLLRLKYCNNWNCHKC